MFLDLRVLMMVVFFFTSMLSKGFSAPSDSYDSRLTGFEYPYKVHNFKLKSQTQNLEMSYMDINPNVAKHTIVLLHGKNFSGFYWKKIAKDLSSRGYRVVIPDQIGFGKSSKPSYYQYSFPQLGINTFALIKSLNIKSFFLVGHSMGGMLAVTLADMYPEAVQKLVLINPIGLEEYQKYVQYKDPNFFYNNEFNKTKEKIIAYQKKNYYAGKWNDSYEALVDPFAKQIHGKDWSLVAWNNALTYGPIFSESIIEKLKRLKMKTHLIIGTRDRTGPGRGWKKPGVTYELGRYDLMKKRIKALNSQIQITELDGLGHMPQFENYSRFSVPFFKNFSSKNSIHSDNTKKSLNFYRWKNRLLVMCDDTPQKKQLTKTLRIVNKNQRANLERKLILLDRCQDKSLRLKKQEVVLIGLDGGVKARFVGFPKMKKIYDMIDSMPMRMLE